MLLFYIFFSFVRQNLWRNLELRGKYSEILSVAYCFVFLDSQSFVAFNDCT